MLTFAICVGISFGYKHGHYTIDLHLDIINKQLCIVLRRYYFTVSYILHKYMYIYKYIN